MISKEQVMPLLVNACPSFSKRWEEHRALYEDEELLYVDLAEFAHHLVELQNANRTEEFRAVFDIIERIHLEGDDYVKKPLRLVCWKAFKMSLGTRELSLNDLSSI